MVSNHTVDKKGLLAFMDKYAGTYPSYSNAVKAAKETCVGETIPGPSHVCEPNRVVLCVSHTMFSVRYTVLHTRRNQSEDFMELVERG